MSLVNDQISDSVGNTIRDVTGSSASESMGILDTVMAETVGMLLYGSVNTLQNAQMIGNAATTSTCAKILSVPLPAKKAPQLPQEERPRKGPLDGASGSMSDHYEKAQSGLSGLNQTLRQAESQQEKAQTLLNRLAQLANGASS